MLGKTDNVPAENQTLNLAEALAEVSEGPEKHTTTLSYGQKAVKIYMSEYLPGRYKDLT